jgi:L-alanine-DL-glutamate epimerase-like enolase superfamily enzyme
MAIVTRPAAVEVERLSCAAYEVPTDEPESDGTLEWDATTIVVVEAESGGERGLGYTYGDRAVATLIESKLREVAVGADVMAPSAAWAAMRKVIRNAGQPGVGAMAVSAVDIALWDLKARLLGVTLADALPRARDSVPIYGSGGFTSYPEARLREQLAGWVERGIPRVKMKVGRDPEHDAARVAAARDVIGPDVELMVDANGAYQRKEALLWAHRLREWDVGYLEEPVSSDDLDGLRLLRDQGPPGMAIAAGEYGWDLPYFRRMLDAGAVDVLQADVTRCGGISALIRLDGLCLARDVPFSAHCAPAVSAHACCAMQSLAHLEYFHDHARLEGMLFHGTPNADGGCLEPDRARPGLGLELRHSEAERFAV